MRNLMRKFLSLLSARERMQLYAQLALLIVMATIDMVGIASILPFMAVVSDPGSIHRNRWLSQTYDVLGFSSFQHFLFFLGMVVLGLLVVGNLFKALYTWVSLKYDNRLNFDLARRLLAAYMARPYKFFLNMNTFEMGKNVLSEVGGVISGVLSPGMQFLANAILCLFIIALLLAVDPFVAIAIVLILGGAYGAIYILARRHLVRIGKEQSTANFLKFRAAGEALSGIKELKVLGREREFVERFSIHALSHARHNATAGLIAQVPRFALETIAFGGILLIVLYSLKTDQEVAKVVPLLSLYAFAGYRLMPALQQLYASISAVRVHLPALEMLYRDMNEGRAAPRLDVILPVTQDLQPLPFERDLVLRDVSFRYDGVEIPAIDKINLTIAPRMSIGLVGPTGSGKTTAVDIILGLLPPTSGKVLVDGTEINGNNLARWQRNLGYIPQHIYLCDDTIARNVAFGVPEQEIDMDAVILASRIAKLHDFVDKELPERYQTVVGERGVRLSGGQRQRIGIARALYRDPPVLIMDEATSALDGITEEAVMDALRVLSRRDKTVIMIAHRLTTVKDCDVIYLMDQGQVVTHGTYDQLLESSPWFQAATRTGT